MRKFKTFEQKKFTSHLRMQNTKENSRFTTQQNYNTLENVKHIIEKNARHITKEGKKKKEHKKIQDFGDTKKLTTRFLRMQNSKESLRFTTQQI